MRATMLIPTAVVAALAACGPRVFEGETAKLIEAPVPTDRELAAKQPRVEIDNDKIVIHEKIQFEYDEATILPVSDSLLDEIATLIRDNPRLLRIRIEGHASAEGDAGHNLDLSRRRAQAVVDHLVGQGTVEPTRLESEGYGEDKPIADNETEEGREANRRVEFTILAQEYTQTKTTVDPSTGEREVRTHQQRDEVGVDPEEVQP